jgi:hypothetical protein
MIGLVKFPIKGLIGSKPLKILVEWDPIEGGGKVGCAPGCFDLIIFGDIVLALS